MNSRELADNSVVPTSLNLSQPLRTAYGQLHDLLITAEQQPPAAGPQQSEVAPIELTGIVYSSTALELSWNRDDIPGVTYNIFRDDQLVRENSPAVSQFQPGLLPNTSYLYTVTPFLNGVEQASDTIVLSTRDI